MPTDPLAKYRNASKGCKVCGELKIGHVTVQLFERAGGQQSKHVQSTTKSYCANHLAEAYEQTRDALPGRS